MKITIVYGSPRKGSTYQCVKIVKDELRKYGDVEFDEVYLPHDAPCFCKGCFTCFTHGKEKCPNANYIQPIVDKMESSDGLIISTPVYVMQITGALKALFDHMAYCYLNHQPRFFKQKALIIVTTAGAGVSNCIKYIKQNLSFWGIAKVFSFGKVMNAANWNEVPERIKTDSENMLKHKAQIFYKELASKKIYQPTFLRAIMFYVGRVMAKGYEKSNADRIHWEKQGWLEEQSEYYIPEVKPNVFARLLGKIAIKILFRNSSKRK